MENKPPAKRSLTRLEKMQAPKPKESFFEVFKKNMLSKTFLGIAGIGVVFLFVKFVGIPAYSGYKLRKAEQFADILWEKEYKHKLQQKDEM
jgi:hypothetical protein